MAVVAPSSAIPTKAPPRLLCPLKMTPMKAAFGVANISQSTLSTPRSLTVLASKSKSQDHQINFNTDNPPDFTSKEDLNYLLKLGGGSILGAAIIKYGSIILPEITRPNIVQALAMISAPVVVAILLLIKQSRNQ